VLGEGPTHLCCGAHLLCALCAPGFSVSPRFAAVLNREYFSVAFRSFCRYGSGNTIIGVRDDRQRQVKQVLGFGIDGCGSNFLNPVKPPSYLRLKITYPRRHRSITCRAERRLSVRTRTLDASVAATSRGSCGPDGHTPDESTTSICRSCLAVAFTRMNSVLWEFISHHVVTCFNAL
jgi:hypothetical protein